MSRKYRSDPTDRTNPTDVKHPGNQNMRLSDIGEQGLIERIAAMYGPGASTPGLVTGIGDDAAVLKPDESSMLTLVTTDMLNENMDFILNSITPWQIGWKAVAVNMSDIAAMGGLPTWTFTSVGLRKDMSVDFVEDLYRGMADCVNEFGSALAGGDSNSVTGDMVLSITQMGKVEPSNLALRSGAREGDRLLVTGYLGDSLAGLKLILNYGIAEARKINDRLVKTHYEPMPRIAEARAAVETGFVHAMMDLSDGLGADLPKMCHASRVGARVYARQLPVSTDLIQSSLLEREDPVELSAGGGEDFELLIAVSPGSADKVSRAIHDATGTHVTEIGEITLGQPEIVYENGSVKPIHGGYQHFK